MAVLGKNTCTPARIYGPLPQTIFCGCSIRGFTVQGGWNEQSSNMTIELVQDTCAGNRVWWNESLVRQSSASKADPGFTYPEPGCAAYFRVEEDPDGVTEALRGGFEYCGIVDGWTEKKDPQGNPVFFVKLTDPRVIIEKTQVIINDFPGSTSGVWNLINAYGFVESLGDTCTSSPAGAIGGFTSSNINSNVANERGMIWNDIRCAVHTLVSSVDRALTNTLYGKYCVDNRIVYVGPNAGEEGYGIIEKDSTIFDPVLSTLPNVNLNKQYYHIDLTELPFSPDSYRISGPNISLMEIISQVCQDAGCDYYVELLPIRNAGKVVKVIKVRASARTNQPQLGRVDDFISAKQADSAQANGGILSYTKGEEVRNEDTSTYLIGGKLRDGFESTAVNMLPFWGLDSNGDLIQARVVSGEYEVRMDLSRLNPTLITPFAGSYNYATERELRAAVKDIDSWKEIALFVNNDFATWLKTVKQVSNLRHDKFAGVASGKIPALALNKGLPDVTAVDHKLKASESRDLDKVYEFVRSYSDEFYGKQFIVDASSFACFTTDIESNKIRWSHEPSTEGCWINDNITQVIGLNHNSNASDFFRDDVGKYQPIIRYPAISGLRLSGSGDATYTGDPSRLGDDNYITNTGTYIWAKAEVDPQWVVGTPLVPAATTLSFLLRVGAPVVNNTSDTNDLIEAAQGTDMMLDTTVISEVKAIDRGALLLAALPFAIAPDAALAPSVSHVQVYGPWGKVGLPGQVNLETDEGFVPWEYGSDDIMYQAALDKVGSSVTHMRKGERGSITVAGFPNIPIGAELFSVDTASPPTSQGNQKYVGTRAPSFALCAANLPYVYCPMNTWVGQFGPNVTNVNVGVGAGGFTTTYEYSTFTPTFGRFNKDNAEKLKAIGQTRLNNMRNLRATRAFRQRVTSSFVRARQAIDNQVGKSARAPKSAHHCIVGRYVDGDRPELNTMPGRELTLACGSDDIYTGVAIMSMDGLFRPVSKSGDGGLTPYVAYSDAQCTGLADHPQMADGPIIEYKRLSVTQATSDPLANPNTTMTDRSDSPGSGHDIEVLGRNTAPPGSGWTIIEGADGGSGYADDYRFPCLKGPMIIQQFGYDLCGKPVPNAADSDASAATGVFVTTALEDKFLDGWLQKPKTWPVAMLDLRLDRERGLWVPPQPPRPLHVNDDGCLLTDKNAATVNAKAVYDDAGSLVSNTTLDVEWPWTIQPPTGIGVMPVYYDNVDCKHYAFPINRLDIARGPNITAPSNVLSDAKRIIFDQADFTVTSDIDTCDRDVFVQVIAAAAGPDVEGLDICSRGAVVSHSFTTLQFGTGLQVKDLGGGTTRVDGTYKIAGTAGLCEEGAVYGPEERWETLSFRSGVAVTDDAVDGCNIYVDAIQFISGTKTCDRLSSNNAFTTLILDSGLEFISVDENCGVKIMSAHKIVGSGCGAFENTTPRRYETLVVGSGLELIQNPSTSCAWTVHAPLIVLTTTGNINEGRIEGQSFKYDANCNSGAGYYAGDTFCAVPKCGSTVNSWGPYCATKPPKYLSVLQAGAGIGFTSCDDCSLLIYNNLQVHGFSDTLNCSTTWRSVQNYRLDFNESFSLYAGPLGTASCGVGPPEEWDVEGNTKVRLSVKPNSDWELQCITGLNVSYADGYVTDVDICCAKLEGHQTCNGEWIITTGIFPAGCTTNKTCNVTTPL